MKESEPESTAARLDGESLWRYVSARGMDRRRFLRLMMVGGATAVLTAYAGTQPTPTQAGSEPSPDLPWFKDPAPFIQHGNKSLEARLENMQGLITPTAFSLSVTTPPL